MNRGLVSFVLFLCACGGGSTDKDGGTVITGMQCSADSDCPSSKPQCVFKISDGCSAQGVCVSEASGPKCGAVEQLCGCSGNMVSSGCGWPSGYASGPTTGMSFCTSDF